MVINENISFNPKQKIGAKLLSELYKYYLFYGGSRAGKTFLACYFVRHRARKYPGSKHLVCRFSFANAKKTVWKQTLHPLLKEDEKAGLCKINTTEGCADYRNGSTISLGGLEPSRIDSVLAAEYETIFVTEANENKWEVIDTLQGRLNGKSISSDGKVISLKMIVDLNPTFKKHWTRLLYIQGLDPDTLELKGNREKYTYLHWRPEDNENNLGDGVIEDLKNLGSVRKKRFYDGEYGDYEGIIFDFPIENRIPSDQIPDTFSSTFAGLDFGYDHPAVLTLYGEHAEKYYLFDWIFERKLDSEVFIDMVKEKYNKYNIQVVYCDPSRPEYIKTLRKHGINAQKANNEVFSGIVFAKDFTGKTYIDESFTGGLNQADSYIWDPNNKDKPLKEEDDFPDTYRYAFYSHLGKGTGPFQLDTWSKPKQRRELRPRRN